MTFLQFVLSAMKGMLPDLLLWGFLPLVPFMIVEQLRPVGQAPRWRDYGMNILIGLSTAYLSLPLGMLAGLWSGSLRKMLPWKPFAFTFDSLGAVPGVGSALELLALIFVPLLLHDRMTSGSTGCTGWSTSCRSFGCSTGFTTATSG